MQQIDVAIDIRCSMTESPSGHSPVSASIDRRTTAAYAVMILSAPFMLRRHQRELACPWESVR
ncbi:MAG: hypothetical protein ACR2RA_22450 [Geminicoccaceae bacterium]